MIPHVCDFEGISINHSLWKMYGSIAGHLTIPSMYHTTSDLKISIQNQNCYSSCRSAASAAEQIPPLRRSFEPVIQEIPNENILYRKSLINSTDLLVPIYIGKTIYKAYRGTIFTDSGQFGTGCQKVDSGRVHTLIVGPYQRSTPCWTRLGISYLGENFLEVMLQLGSFESRPPMNSLRIQAFDSYTKYLVLKVTN